MHHILPLEFYPPVTNFLNVLSRNQNLKVVAYSTTNNKSREPYSNKLIRIYRSIYPSYSVNFFQKIISYIIIVCGPLLRMLLFRPHNVIYFEPHSSYPVYLYKRYFNRNVNVFIHYHEYYSKTDFNGNGMSLIKFFNKREVNYLFRKACWISQTNQSRLDLFAEDYPWVEKDKLKTLANFPPKSWRSYYSKRNDESKIKLLYIGALSFENTYIEEIIEFVRDNAELLELDIYSYNLKDNVKNYLNALNLRNVRCHLDGVEYNQIPVISSNYNVGLVLYKGHNQNYIHNAPNKLFEYLACGLTVWVSANLKGCKPYLNAGKNPGVLEVDYTNLNEKSLLETKKVFSNAFEASPFNCEEELGDLIGLLIGDNKV